MLRNTGEPVDNELTVSHPTDGSSGPVLRERYLGKELIYFVKDLRSRWNVGGRTEIRSVLMFTKVRYVVYPHALEQLEAVRKTITTQ